MSQETALKLVIFTIPKSDCSILILKKKKFITKSGLPFAVDAARSVYYYTLVTIQAMKIYFSILKIIHLCSKLCNKLRKWQIGFKKGLKHSIRGQHI